MTTKKDPLAEKLSNTKKKDQPGRVETLFSDRPQVLKSIETARKTNKLSFQNIADVLNTEDGITVSSGAIQTYLSKKGIS